jgi:glucosyl-dolichyl phosphate glucuronosyltransferase
MEEIGMALVETESDRLAARDAEEPSIGVVICAYTEARWPELEKAVRSVQRQSRPARELVVVIDHNEQLLARARAAFLGARVVSSTARPGLSGARNTGVAHSSTSIVAFLDDDACAARDWLETLATVFDDDRVVGAGGWIAPRWEAPDPTWLPPELYWIVGCSYQGLPPDGAELRNAIGANMAFRRAALADVGGFREGVGRVLDRPLGDEETQLGIEVRARWPHCRIVHATGARVKHSVPAQRTTWRYLLSRCWYEGRSKALLTGAVGSSSALASERTYVARALPAGFARGLRDVLRGDVSGLARAASIATALATTAAGYLFGRLAQVARSA